MVWAGQGRLAGEVVCGLGLEIGWAVCAMGALSMSQVETLLLCRGSIPRWEQGKPCCECFGYNGQRVNGPKSGHS
jgi:hypothetical protein